VSSWPASKARRVLATLLRLGWAIKRQSGSHRTLARDGWPDVVFAFHDDEEIGPRMLARLAKHTGLRPEDLQAHDCSFWSAQRAASAAAAHDRTRRRRLQTLVGQRVRA
jgi:predicted RNA binding protein YcfA (HicA-like mRNA interferase family)